jgi:hypothetical protein
VVVNEQGRREGRKEPSQCAADLLVSQERTHAGPQRHAYPEPDRDTSLYHPPRERFYCLTPLYHFFRVLTSFLSENEQKWAALATVVSSMIKQPCLVTS